jgi:hypothetical protein
MRIPDSFASNPLRDELFGGLVKLLVDAELAQLFSQLLQGQSGDFRLRQVRGVGGDGGRRIYGLRSADFVAEG